MPKISKWVKEKTKDYAFVGVFLAVLTYAAWTSWKNAAEISQISTNLKKFEVAVVGRLPNMSAEDRQFFRDMFAKQGVSINFANVNQSETRLATTPAPDHATAPGIAPWTDPYTPATGASAEPSPHPGTVWENASAHIEKDKAGNWVSKKDAANSDTNSQSMLPKDVQGKTKDDHSHEQLQP